MRCWWFALLESAGSEQRAPKPCWKTAGSGLASILSPLRPPLWRPPDTDIEDGGLPPSKNCPTCQYGNSINTTGSQSFNTEAAARFNERSPYRARKIAVIAMAVRVVVINCRLRPTAETMRSLPGAIQRLPGSNSPRLAFRFPSPPAFRCFGTASDGSSS